MPRGRKQTPIADRFWSKVNKETGIGCWLWTASTSNGYGAIGRGGAVKRGASAMLSAHRVAYELVVGPIPQGLHLDHLCRNRACVNPEHLEPVTVQENVLRGVGPCARNARKTHCPRGHELAGENLAADRLKLGQRTCEPCRALKNRARWIFKRENARQAKFNEIPM